MADGRCSHNAYGEIVSSGLEDFVQHHLHADCEAVFKLAAPATTALCTMADKLVDKITKDLEACLSRAAKDKRPTDLKPRTWDAETTAPCYEPFLLFVAHHVKAYSSEQVVAELVDPQDFRLILPIAQADTETEGTEYLDPRDFARVLCGMLPLASNVEGQKTIAPHLIVADTEVMSDKRDYDKVELKLAKETKALFFRQHNR
ncbi:hypothetical protein GGI20_005454, partial [Coemansia sp. BCRC 34301]